MKTCPLTNRSASHLHPGGRSGNRFVTLLLAAGLLSVSAGAQTTTTAAGQTADNSSTTGNVLITDTTEAKLVALALAGPQMTNQDHQNKVLEYQLKGAKNAWMNLLTVSTNYNDRTIQQGAIPGAYTPPKYFFGVTIPLGTILSRTQVKAAREGVEIGKLNQEQLERTIVADVRSKYRQYKAYNQLIVNQSELINDVEATLIQTEEKFRKGTITIEMYNAAQRIKTDEQARLINLQMQKDLVVIELERVTGSSLATVLR